MVHGRRFLKICSDMKILWYLAEFLRISFLNNENFKMEVEQTNFVAHVIITVQNYYIID